MTYKKLPRPNIETNNHLPTYIVATSPSVQSLPSFAPAAPIPMYASPFPFPITGPANVLTIHYPVSTVHPAPQPLSPRHTPTPARLCLPAPGAGALGTTGTLGRLDRWGPR